MLTDRDLSRLLALQYVHGGDLSYVPHGVGASFDVLADNELVKLEGELIGGAPVDMHATITDKGRRVAEAGMMAMKEALK